MPFTYRIDSDAGILFVVGEGVVTQQERMEAMRAWLKDPAYRPGLHTLCDFSRAASTPTFEELRQIVMLMSQHVELIGKKKVAVVTSRAITFGVARQFETLLEGSPVDVHVFGHHTTALAWLTEDQS